MKKILTICGTRPEAIKLAPLLLELKKRENEVQSILCVTAQHRQMLDSVFNVFSIQPDIDLNLMQPGQHLTDLLSRALVKLKDVLVSTKPDALVVQGDTTTVLAASLAAFHEQVPVMHVEAGLRTWQKYLPFPEEMNRRVTGNIASMNFAPTPSAKENLLRENVDPATILVTGNTVIDALYWVRDRLSRQDLPSCVDSRLRMILLTSHRRENLGEPMRRICTAVREIVSRYDDVQVVYPMHMNPRVREVISAELKGHPRIELIEPVEYVQFVTLMNRATLLLTDSGGVQEEGPALGKPVLVLRDTSERPEAVRAGAVQLVGTDTNRIVSECSRLLNDADAYAAASRVLNVYGDGLASRRIADYLITGHTALSEFMPECGSRSMFEQRLDSES